MRKFNLLWLFMMFFVINGFSQFQLNTVPPLNGGNGQNGVTFNVTANQTLMVDTIFVSFTGTGSAEVWYNPNPINGAPTINAANGWVQLVSNAPITTAVGAGNIQPIPAQVGLIIPAGLTYGFYVGGPSLAYSNGTAGVASPYSDANMTIECGDQVGYGGPAPNPTFHVREFNGGIKYTVVGGSNDAAVLSVDSPTVFCSGSQNIAATIGNYGVNQIDSVDVHWEIDGVAQPTFQYIGLLDTIGGNNPNTAQVILGSYNFPSGLTEIKVYTSNPNGVADTSNYNDTTVVMVGPALNGVYTVNPANPTGGTNFNSIADMNYALNTFGVCGPTTINVANGTYNEAIYLDNVPGLSAANHLTIDGGDSSQTILSQSSQFATLTLNGSPNVHVKNLTLEQTGTSGDAVIFSNGSQYDTLSSCVTRVDVNSTSSVFYNISFSSSTTSNSTGVDANYNVVQNNRIIGGYYGIRIYGSSTMHNVGNRFVNNEIDSSYYYGIYGYYQDSLEVIGNSVNVLSRGNVSSYGIMIYYSENYNLIANEVHAGYSAMYLYNYTTYVTSNRAKEVSNNMLHTVGNTSGSSYTMYIYYVDEVNMWNNSIYDEGTSTTTASVMIGANTTVPISNYDIRNNIFMSEYSTSYQTNVSGHITDFDNNIFYNGSGGAIISDLSGTYTDIASYQSTNPTFNQNSLQGDPEYLSSTDLHILGVLPNDNGDATVPLNEDIDGDVRPSPNGLSVDIGADEFDPPALDASISGIHSPDIPFCVGNYLVSAVITNGGIDTITTVKVYWDLDGVLDSTVYNGSIAMGDTGVVNLDSMSFVNGVAYDLKVYTSMPNNAADMRQVNDTLDLSGLRAALSGVYTVDASQATGGTNFNSISDMNYALNTFGVCGPTLINVSNGTYSDAISLNNVLGLSAANYLTIDGGDSSQTIVSQGAQFGSLILNGVTNVHVKNFTFEQTNTQGDGVIFSNGTRYDTLSSCVVRVDPTSTDFNLRGIMFSSSTSSNSSGVLSDYNVIQNNKIIGGYYGIYIYGSTSDLNSYNQFLNNEIDSAYYYGMYTDYQDSLEVVGNTINMTNRGNQYSYAFMGYYSNNTKFSKNYIWAGGYGVYFYNYYTYAPIKRRFEVSNNMIYSESDYGIYMYSVDSADIWHNSIHVEGTLTPALQISHSTVSPISEYDVRNNILSSVNTEALEVSVPDTIFIKLDYNVYNSNGPVLINIDGVGYATLAGYQSVQPSFNTASLEGNPQFVSNTDLHILGSFVDGQADATLGITEDIDGDPRPMPGATNVDIGADEFDPPSCPRPLNFSFYNSSIDSVTVAWDGDISAGDYEIEIVNCGDPQGSGTTSVIVGDSVTLGGLTPNLCYEIYVREICARGDTSLWADPFKFGLRDSCESFDNYVLGPVDEQSILIDGWDNAQGDAEVSNDYASSGSNSLKIHDSGPAGYSDVIANLDTYTSGKWNISIDFLIPQGYGGYYNILHNYLGGGGSVWAIETYLDASGVATVNEGSNGTGVIGTYNFTPGAWNSISHIIDLDNDTAYLLMNGAPTNVGWQFSLGAPNGNQFNAFNFFSAANAGQTPLMYFDNFCIKAFEEAPVDGAIVGLAAPLDNGLQCYTSTEAVSVDLINAGLDSLDFTVDTAEVTMVISGAASQTLSFTVSDNTLNGGVPLARGESIEVPLGTFDMSTIGTYYFDAIVDITADGVQTNDAYSDSITTQAVEGGMVSDNDSICAGDTTTITLSNYYGAIQWQEFDGTAWVDIIGANEPTVDVDPMNTTEYRALVCGTDVSDTVEVYVTNIQFNVINNPTVVACDSTGTDTLIATTTMNGVEFTWYDAPVDGNIVHEGDTLLFTGSPSSTNQTAADTFYVSGATGSAADTLTAVPFTGGNSCGGGNMFDLMPKQNLEITGFELNTTTGAGNPVPVDVYIKTGTYNGSQTNAAAWTLVASGTGTSAGNGNPTQVILNTPVQLPANTLTGMYVYFEASYTNLPANTLYTSPALDLYTGDGLCGLFTGNNVGRGFNGRIYYGGGCESPRQMVIGSVDCAVGLEDNSAVAGNIEVYPNPSNGLFTLNITTEQEENFILSVRDVQGKLIYEESLTVNGAHRDDLDFVGLAKGVYYLQIQNDQATKVERLIIQ